MLDRLPHRVAPALLLAMLLAGCDEKPTDVAPPATHDAQAPVVVPSTTPPIAAPGAPDTPSTTPTATASPSPSPLIDALKGESPTGRFWFPVKGTFPDEDILLRPMGEYITHSDDRPVSMGTWRVDGDTLTLDKWMGNGKWVVRELHVAGGELRGTAEGKELVMRRKPPRPRKKP